MRGGEHKTSAKATLVQYCDHNRDTVAIFHSYDKRRTRPLIITIVLVDESLTRLAQLTSLHSYSSHTGDSRLSQIPQVHDTISSGYKVKSMSPGPHSEGVTRKCPPRHPSSLALGPATAAAIPWSLLTQSGQFVGQTTATRPRIAHCISPPMPSPGRYSLRAVSLSDRPPQHGRELHTAYRLCHIYPPLVCHPLVVTHSERSFCRTNHRNTIENCTLHIASVISMPSPGRYSLRAVSLLDKPPQHDRELQTAYSFLYIHASGECVVDVSEKEKTDETLAIFLNVVRVENSSVGPRAESKSALYKHTTGFLKKKIHHQLH
ncbi:hypothetical protein J6590_027048 [Homalodisca vitripennis]|nr:hypothetical protein J6590_027048 [Homalodisca vitripennis]